jgi:HPt (histidine-containing phosphotransfer) domain-containing protein
MRTSFAANGLRIETLDVISQVIGPVETRELLQSLVASMESGLAELRLAELAGDFTVLARAAWLSLPLPLRRFFAPLLCST